MMVHEIVFMVKMKNYNKEMFVQILFVVIVFSVLLTKKHVCLSSILVILSSIVPHGDDEFTNEDDQSLSITKCEQYEDEGCLFLREYVWKSVMPFNSSIKAIAKAKLPFYFYCNTFWDLKDRSDETVDACRSWVCSEYEFQCGTGQCIPKHYVCDGEWDCPDASDELFDINHLSDHNNQMIDLSHEKKACIAIISNKTQAFDSFCNTSTEYPCLLINFSRPSDIFKTRPCINISQIGDNIIDCLGGFDEKNTLVDHDEMYQLGFTFQCRSSSSEHINDENLCTSSSRCRNQNDDLPLCGDRNENCSHSKDFLCINGSCIANGRCDGNIDCQYAEDEYWCNPNKLQTKFKKYRASKRENRINTKKHIALPRYPSGMNATEESIEAEQERLVKRDIPTQSNSLKPELMCNRGVAVLHYTNTTICFCPPSYYGEYCEYYSDRSDKLCSFKCFELSLCTTNNRYKYDIESTRSSYAQQSNHSSSAILFSTSQRSFSYPKEKTLSNIF